MLAEAAAALNKPAAGYEITSTIEQPLQQVLEQAATLSGQPATLQAAAVVTEPKTGRVLAYYGGPTDAKVDFAATPHPPGQTFAAYDLAAALQAGISTQSRWKASASMAFPDSGRSDSHPLTAARRCPRGAAACTLTDAATGGLLIPLYAVTERSARRNWSRSPARLASTRCRRSCPVGRRTSTCAARNPVTSCRSTSAVRSASASTASRCWTTPTAWPPSPSAACARRHIP